MRQPQQLPSLDSGTNSHSSSLVASRFRITRSERDVLEAMRVQNKRAVPGGTSHEVVAGVANDQSEVVNASEVDGSLHMLPSLG